MLADVHSSKGPHCAQGGSLEKRLTAVSYAEEENKERHERPPLAENGRAFHYTVAMVRGKSWGNE